MQKKFIKVGQVVGSGPGIGPFSLFQLPLLFFGFALFYILNVIFQQETFTSGLIAAWVTAPLFIIIGNRPDRIIKRMIGKPRKWRRGLVPAKSLLKRAEDR